MPTIVVEVFELQSDRDTGKNAIEKHEVTTKKQLRGKVLELGTKAVASGKTVLFAYRQKATNHFVSPYKNAERLLA